MKSSFLSIPSPPGGSPLFSLPGGGILPPPDMETCRNHLLSFSREISVPRGAKLMMDRVHYVLEGVVALTAVSATGSRHALVYFEPGDLLGFSPSVNHVYSIPHAAFDFLLFNESLAMFAKTPCRLICVEHRDFIVHMDEEPVKSLLMRGLAGNLLKVIVQFVNNCTLPAPVRVCRMLSVFMEKEAPHFLPRYLTHTEIAGHLSLHVMTVTKIFQSLRRQGILGKEHGRPFVRDPAKLLSLASEQSLLSVRA